MSLLSHLCDLRADVSLPTKCIWQHILTGLDLMEKSFVAERRTLAIVYLPQNYPQAAAGFMLTPEWYRIVCKMHTKWPNAIKMKHVLPLAFLFPAVPHSHISRTGSGGLPSPTKAV